MLFTAAFVTSAVWAPANIAIASPRHGAAARPIHLGTAKTRAAQHTMRSHRQRALVRLGSARVLPFHHRAMHSPSLTNATWDNPHISPEVARAVQNAALASGVDPNLISAIAWRESRFDASARNQRSSARGLLQFTTGTWLQAVRDLGPKVGLGDYANAIHRDRTGSLSVSEPRVLTAILNLRGNPVLSAQLAAESIRRQRELMQIRLGRTVTPVDLYLLHVLGPSGASRFLVTLVQRPSLPSIEVASLKVMRNAGLVAGDGRPMTVAKTYAAVEAMLNDQRSHTESLFARTPVEATAAAQNPTEVSEAPF